MTNYAIITAAGKQYKVTDGLTLDVDKLDGNAGDKVSFEEVLFVSDGAAVTVGTPHVKGAVVTATIVEQLKDEKIRVAKFKAKSRYRKVNGFRAQITKIKIDGIKGGAK